MTNWKLFTGLAGSEIERAAMVSGIFPTESVLERSLKQQAAKILARLAGYIDPAVVQDLAIPKKASHC